MGIILERKIIIAFFLVIMVILIVYSSIKDEPKRIDINRTITINNDGSISLVEDYEIDPGIDFFLSSIGFITTRSKFQLTHFTVNHFPENINLLQNKTFTIRNRPYNFIGTKFPISKFINVKDGGRISFGFRFKYIQADILEVLDSLSRYLIPFYKKDLNTNCSLLVKENVTIHCKEDKINISSINIPDGSHLNHSDSIKVSYTHEYSLNSNKTKQKYISEPLISVTGKNVRKKTESFETKVNLISPEYLIKQISVLIEKEIGKGLIYELEIDPKLDILNPEIDIYIDNSSPIIRQLSTEEFKYSFTQNNINVSEYGYYVGYSPTLPHSSPGGKSIFVLFPKSNAALVSCKIVLKYNPQITNEIKKISDFEYLLRYESLGIPSLKSNFKSVEISIPNNFIFSDVNNISNKILVNSPNNLIVSEDNSKSRNIGLLITSESITNLKIIKYINILVIPAVLFSLLIFVYLYNRYKYLIHVIKILTTIFINYITFLLGFFMGNNELFSSLLFTYSYVLLIYAAIYLLLFKFILPFKRVYVS